MRSNGWRSELVRSRRCCASKQGAVSFLGGGSEGMREKSRLTDVVRLSLIPDIWVCDLCATSRSQTTWLEPTLVPWPRHGPDKVS